MGIKSTMAENPAMTSIISIGSVVVAIMSIGKGVEFADEMIVTEKEARMVHEQHDAQMVEIGDKMDSQAILNECRWLSDKIDRIEYEIYTMERDGVSGDFVQPKRQQRERLRNRYVALSCASRLTV